MYCCSNCFSDSFLNLQIKAMSNKKGQCSYCKTKNTTLIQPQALVDYFESLLSIYKVDKEGIFINQLLQEDWSLFAFSYKIQQKRLLTTITQDKNLTKLKYMPKYLQDDSIINQWHLFTEELKYRNRFLPEYSLDKDLFVELGSLLGIVYEKDKYKFCRARINKDGKQFKIRDLKKPPAEIVLNGRANPLGIPYLYVASTIDTAIAEIRGHKGENVTVLEFNNNKSLALFDLREPKNTISPFELSESLEFIYKHMPYLVLLGDELSKPIIPRKANLDYLTSQYLCEMIKQIGFHGIIYKSSIADGNNYVIFSDNRLRTGSMHQYRITEMSFRSELII